MCRLHRGYLLLWLVVPITALSPRGRPFAALHALVPSCLPGALLSIASRSLPTAILLLA